MSKGLKALDRVKKFSVLLDSEKDIVKDLVEIIPNTLKTIEKELKALEIIKNKMNEQNNSTLYYPAYVDLKGDFHLVFHKEEYDLLKEVCYEFFRSN